MQANQFEEFGAIKENVRHNEKAIDRLEQDVKEIRVDIKALSEKLTSFQLQFYGGVLIILAANIALKYLP
jgi:uncharacterized protein YlaN (UPF0358 family)